MAVVYAGSSRGIIVAIDANTSKLLWRKQVGSSEINGFEIDNKIVSFLNYSLIYNRIEIEYIYTDSEYRNRGIASKLLNYLVDLGINNNCLNITLEVKKSNFNAIKFYEKNGFKKISIRKNYYNGEDGIMMLRELV